MGGAGAGCEKAGDGDSLAICVGCVKGQIKGKPTMLGGSGPLYFPADRRMIRAAEVHLQPSADLLGVPQPRSDPFVEYRSCVWGGRS